MNDGPTWSVGRTATRAVTSLRYRGRRFLRSVLWRDGTLDSLWARQELNVRVAEILRPMVPTQSRAAGIENDHWSQMHWRSFDTVPLDVIDEGVVAPELSGAFDVVVCDQYLNQVSDPLRSLGSLVQLVRPGGTVIVATPFLIKVHPFPGDLWRFTAEGLASLMQRAGLTAVHVESWGNRSCARANLRRWTPRRRWHSTRNEPEYPVVVWGSGVRPPDWAVH